MSISRRTFAAGAATGLAALALPGLSGCSTIEQALSKLQSTQSSTHHFDVIVVGAGGAGMCAAVSAYDAGASVLVLEKTLQTGGNTSFTESGMNAAGTTVQEAAGIQDSPEAFADDTLKGGHNAGKAELVHYMCGRSAEAIGWLEGLGVTLDSLASSAGMQVMRAHRPTNQAPIGSVLVPALEKALASREIPLIFGSVVQSLVIDDAGVCRGVVTTDEQAGETTYTARSVVLATGGMCSNMDMVQTYRPDLQGCISTNSPAATGDGYTMAQDAGAQLEHMDAIQIHPTVAIEAPNDGHPPLTVPDGVRTSGGILLNANAERFFDETSVHSYVAEALLNQPGQWAWLVFDEEVCSHNPALVASLEPRGVVVQGATASELAAKINLNAEAMQTNLDAYYTSVAESSPDPFGRTTNRRVFEGPLFAMKVGVGAHYQMGGVSIDTQNRALDGSGNAIAGLFAAGEVTGGVHGLNRLGGNGICDAVVFGRNAGLEAAEYASIARAAAHQAGASAGAAAGIAYNQLSPKNAEG